jgi:hypothetical protein
VAVGNLDSDTDLDFVASSDNAAGEVLLFRNDGGGTFTPSTVAAGANPRSVRLEDMNSDGKLDAVLVNDQLNGTLSVLLNRTTAATLTFAAPLVTPLSGSRSNLLALADTNQDGLKDVAVGYANSEFVSVLAASRPGIIQVGTDRQWLDSLYRALVARSIKSAEMTTAVSTLTSGYLAYLKGPDGTSAPLSITSTGTSNLTYSLAFGAQLMDGTYKLFIGPNAQGVNLKDFIDLDGSFKNTGNAMNQDRDTINGENPGDRLRIRFAVNNNDNGRFISALYEDFQGPLGSGRDPDSEGFIALNTPVEAARQAAQQSLATTFVSSQEEVNHLITDLYQTYLGQGPGADLAPARARIMNGTATLRTLLAELLAGSKYDALLTPDPDLPSDPQKNRAWLKRVYADLLPGSDIPDDANFDQKLTALNSGAKTRAQIANNLVKTNALVLERAVADLFLKFLGRRPVRNADPALDEIKMPRADLGGVSYFDLLKQGPVAGQLSPEQRLIKSLVLSPEYFRFVGASNFEWVKSLYLRVYGRTSIDTSAATGTEFNTKLNALLTGYTAARKTALSTVLNSAEFRSRFYAGYNSEFLTGPVPTSLSSAAQEAFYQANGQRLEAVVANLLRDPAYFPLTGSGSQNSTWLEKIYGQLLNRGTANDSTAASQLAFLQANSQTTAQLSAARYKVALQVLNTDEYRRILVTKFYVTYLGRTPSTTERDKWVNLLKDPTFKQENVLIGMLKGPEYFLLQ